MEPLPPKPSIPGTTLLLYVPSVQSSSCAWLAQRHSFTINALGLQRPLSAAFDLRNTVHLRNLEKKGNTISQAQLAAFLDCHAAASKWNFELKIVSLKDSVAKINEQFDNLKREQIRLVSLANPPCTQLSLFPLMLISPLPQPAVLFPFTDSTAPNKSSKTPQNFALLWPALTNQFRNFNILPCWDI